MPERSGVRLSKLNIGLIVLLLFLAYVIFNIISYLGKPKIYSYEVTTGSLAKNNIYEAVAIRSETVMYANDSGYIDYFARETEHVGIGDLVYSIDQSGIINDLIAQSNGGENTLTNDDLEDLKKEVVSFCALYDDTNFARTYDFLYNIDGMVLKLANKNMLEQISQANSTSDSIKLCYADTTGYVVYSTDGYESLSLNGINAEIFNKDTYERNQLITSSLVDKGQETYKLITSDDWYLAIQLEPERAEELQNSGYVTVKFLEDQRLVTASINVIQEGDDFFGIIALNQSVPCYATERFIEIELITEEQTGLKIPVSAIVRKEFYIVPEEYAFEPSGENSFYFCIKTFKEDGTLSAETISLQVYDLVDGYYYVDDDALQIGDYLLKDGGASEYAVAMRGELTGVYNINMGYASFRKINILYQNEEYAIVSSNSIYGLRQYDFIVLDASAVQEDDFIYE